MLKDRLQEIVEFTKSESPYRKANKGWINQDIFLDLSPSVETLKQKKEAAKVTLFWSPINNLLSNIFIIIIISSILVFTSLSLSKGRLSFDSFNTSLISNIVKFEDNKVSEDINVTASDSVNSENEESLAIKKSDKITNINSLDDNPTNLDQKVITSKIEKEDRVMEDNETNKDIKIIENKRSKSNFI